jgi:hypothetical protein
MKILILILVSLLNSCSMTSSQNVMHVSKPAPKKYAPKDYQNVGIIKYLRDRNDSVNGTRKDTAYQMMSGICNSGSYKIIHEGEKADIYTTSDFQEDTDSLPSSTTRYWYMKYQCLSNP